MSIKKIITGLAFSMLLGSGAANADWGDVYYCQMTNFVDIKLEGEKKNYKLEKFQFKLDQTKNAMVFGSTGAFKNEVIELTNGMNYHEDEMWFAGNTYYGIFFLDGKVLIASTYPAAIRSVSADCDKF
jgi:hypothetical protein